MTKYLKLYNIEEYLFDTVRNNFRNAGRLSAFDFFCIVIWKANRAKSKIALKLLQKDNQGRKDLNAIVGDMTSAVHKAKTDKERMRVLIENWSFRLPMASAILTVLYPDNFTVYDIRVCTILNDCFTLQNKTRFDDLWSGYEDFIGKVNHKAPPQLSLRDKDRYLWGMSFEKDLIEDIANLFRKENQELD